MFMRRKSWIQKKKEKKESLCDRWAWKIPPCYPQQYAAIRLSFVVGDGDPWSVSPFAKTTHSPRMRPFTLAPAWE